VNVTLKFIGLVAILLVGVVLGLQTAERGLQKVEGVPAQNPQTFYIKKVDNGKMEIAVMGKQLSADAGKATTYVSHFGETLGDFVRDGTRKLIDWVAALF
jgi:hypothetical protein